MDFTRKASFVSGGLTTELPSAFSYSIVESRDSVWLSFMIAALNSFDIMSCDLENAYLNATKREKIWFEGGIKCSEDKGNVLVVVRDLYGHKSKGSAWMSALIKVLVQLGFRSIRAELDVWI